MLHICAHRKTKKKRYKIESSVVIMPEDQRSHSLTSYLSPLSGADTAKDILYPGLSEESQQKPQPLRESTARTVSQPLQCSLPPGDYLMCPSMSNSIRLKITRSSVIVYRGTGK